MTDHTPMPPTMLTLQIQACGCEIEATPGVLPEWRQVRCPLHESASDLLAALERLCENGVPGKYDTRWQQARAAIAKATEGDQTFTITARKTWPRADGTLGFEGEGEA